MDCKHIVLPKLGKIRISRLRDNVLNMQDVRIGTATVKKDSADNYTISLQLGSTQPFVKALPKTNQSIGVDLNTENYLTDSQGNVVANPRFYRRIKHQLAKQQRALSRRARRAKKEHRSLRDIKNYQKQRLLVANLHEKIYRQRKDFLNNLTTKIIKNHDIIVAEELRSKNLLKNHALALSISDVGWRTFLSQLEYKAKLYDKQFITVSPKNTTQTCHCCGYVCGSDNHSKKLTLAERKWTCPNCNTIHIRDKNAAINILNKGLAKLASA